MSKPARKGQQAAHQHVGKMLTDNKGVAQNLAALIAMPTRPFRLPTVERQRTAVCHLRQLQTVTTGTTVVPPVWGSQNVNDLIMAFYGQPGRLALLWTATTAGAQYSAVFTMLGNSMFSTANTYPNYQGNTWFILEPSASITLTTEPFPFGISWPLTGFGYYQGGTSRPHGDYYASGNDTGNNYIFMNATDVLTIFLTSAGASMAGNLMMSVWQWQGPKQNPAPAAPGGGNLKWTLSAGGTANDSLTFTASQAGYYTVMLDSFHLTAGSVAELKATASITCNATNGWSHFSAKDFLGAPYNISGAGPIIGRESRVNGASCLMTNVTPHIYRGGAFIGCRVMADTPVWVLSRAALEDKKNVTTHDGGLGAYSFMESTENRHQYYRHSEVNALQFDLSDNSLYNVFVFSPPAASAQTFEITFELAVEYQSDAPVANTMTYAGPGTANDMAVANGIINSVPAWFFENPMHMSDIYGWVKRGAKSFMKHAPGIAAGMSGTMPSAAAGLGGLVQLMRAMGV